MSDTKRELIIQACLVRAASITMANGYNTDMGPNVFRAITNIDPFRLPSCSIFPLIETTEKIGGGEYSCTMPVKIEVIAAVGAFNPSVLSELILGDLRKAFNGSSLTTLIEEILYASGGTSDYSHKDTVPVTVNFTIKYFSKINDPYA